MEKVSIKRKGRGKTREPETYRDAGSLKEIKMEPNLSISRKRKVKASYQERSHLLVTSNLETLDLKNQLPFVLPRGHLGSD